MNLSQQHTVNSNDEIASLHLLEQALGYSFPAALRAATILGVAEHLIDGPKTAQELANKVHAKGPQLHRILRLLATRDVFCELDNGKFGLTLAAEYLCGENKPYSLKKAILMITDETCWRSLGEIVESVRGNPSFKHIYGLPFFDYWAQKSNENNKFDAGMSSMSEMENMFLIRNYRFPQTAIVADIAGGLGGLLLGILQANPLLHGILFDKPHVLACHRLGELDDDSRWDIVSGNFFVACPVADIYLLKYIMHGWSDQQAATILRNCRESMLPGGCILIMDPIISKDNSSHMGKKMDIFCMGIHESGYERTKDELDKLVESAGLRINRIIETGSYISIIEAVVE